MIELPSDAGRVQWVDVPLVPDERATKAPTRNFAVPELQGWLSLGVPIVSQVDASGASDSSAYDYFHVLLAASFRPQEDAPFDRVWTQVELTPRTTGEAIAWSMYPMKEATAVEVTRKVGLDASVSLHGATGKIGSETEHSYNSENVFLLAYNLQASNPVWEFSATESQPVRGAHSLHLIVRRSKNVPVVGRVSVTATVSYKRLGIFTVRSKVAALPELQFSIA